MNAPLASHDPFALSAGPLDAGAVAADGSLAGDVGSGMSSRSGARRAVGAPVGIAEALDEATGGAARSTTALSCAAGASDAGGGLEATRTALEATTGALVTRPAGDADEAIADGASLATSGEATSGLAGPWPAAAARGASSARDGSGRADAGDAR